MGRMINDHFQNFKKYNIPKAQLLIADIPYNIGNDAYGSNPSWYIDGDRKNGESEKAGKQFFDTDKDFRISEFMHFCGRMVKREHKPQNYGKMSPSDKHRAGCMIVFCEFEQQFKLINYMKEHKECEFKNYIPLVFRKNYSAQVLKANMRPVSNVEQALILYRDSLPKFMGNPHAGKKMVFTCIDWVRDTKTPTVHPTQKPVPVLQYLIECFTEAGDVVIDPCAGSGSTLLAGDMLGRKTYGFEIKKEFCDAYEQKINKDRQMSLLEIDRRQEFERRKQK